MPRARRACPHAAAARVVRRESGKHRQQRNGDVPLAPPPRPPPRLLEQSLQLCNALVEATLARARRRARSNDTHRMSTL